MRMKIDHDSITAPLMARAAQNPEHVSVVFIEHESANEITAGQLNQQAQQFSQALQQLGIGRDDLVILVLPHSEILLSAFWGALYLGAIPSIFPFLTEKLDRELYLSRVKKLVAHSQAKAVITYPEFKGELTDLLSDLDCSVLDTDEALSQVSDDVKSGPANSFSADKIAFLQHSSGTTGLQKGVALSHQAVLNQIEAYSQAIDLTTDDVIVSWLPLYHDMGLIAGFVMPLVTGVPLVIMSPFEWVRKPQILLEAIDKYKGTLSWLPNFAYNHMARVVRPKFIEGIDLSHWRAAINCSEPALAESHRLFFEKFSEFGFQAGSLATCYAMAENTFAVTQSALGRQPNIDQIDLKILQEERKATPVSGGKSGIEMVSCGQAIEGTEIQIIDGGDVLPERAVGEIAVRGNAMLSEYYRNPEITAAALRNGWYLSGDMGYIAEGELYITGRKKDLIIVGGKNIYPQDLETIANDIEGIHPGRAVAFGIFDDRIGTESVAMVCELSEDGDDESMYQIELELRGKIAKATEVALSDIRLVSDRWVIKTSSGKIARDDNRKKYLKEFRNVNSDI